MSGKVDNSTYDSSAHQVGASKLKYMFWFVTNALFFAFPLNFSSGIKVMLLKMFGAHIGTGVYIKPGATVKYPWKLTVGDYSWIGENAWIDNVEEVIIGKNCCISQGALLLTGSHDHTKPTFDYLSESITLEDGAWIGAKAVVGKGVTCGSHCILGINSVAEKDMDPYVIYKGNPAMAVTKRTISE